MKLLKLKNQILIHTYLAIHCKEVTWFHKNKLCNTYITPLLNTKLVGRHYHFMWRLFLKFGNNHNKYYMHFLNKDNETLKNCPERKTYNTSTHITEKWVSLHWHSARRWELPSNYATDCCWYWYYLATHRHSILQSVASKACTGKWTVYKALLS